MRKNRRPVAFILILVFGILIFKNIIPNTDASAKGSCEEFGHIHYHFFANHSLTTENNCHEGKSVAFVFPDHKNLSSIVVFEFKVIFSLVANSACYFKSPTLGPLRRPPRLS